MKGNLALALAAAAVIIAIVMSWKKKTCVQPIPLRSTRAMRAQQNASRTFLNAAEPCPPPGCADFAVCSTGNLTKRLRSSAARFPDIDVGKINDGLSMRLLQGCDGTDVGACADYLPYVCSCSGLSDLCRNAPDPKPDVCKQNPRTPTAAYGINCSDIRLTQGPCPCDCEEKKPTSCPNIAGDWHIGDIPVKIVTTPPDTAGKVCSVVFNVAGSVYPGYIPQDRPYTIVWSFDSALEPAVIDPSLARIVHGDRIYTKG